MDLVKDFLPTDLQSATKEYLCIINCLYIQQDALINSDYKKARVMSENVTRSLKELERLREKKKRYDELINSLESLKVEIEIIRRVI